MAGTAQVRAGGTLLGIARKAFPRAAMELLPAARLSRELGVEGDDRGVWKEGRANKRQVTMFAQEDWQAALAEIGADADWSARRCNLFVEGLALPRDLGAIVRVGAVTLEVTGECDPCKRMEAVAEGLFPALAPDWRGGRLLRVVEAGHIRVGDKVTVEE